MGCCFSSSGDDDSGKNDTTPLARPISKTQSSSSMNKLFSQSITRTIPLLENNSTFKNAAPSDSSSSPIEKELLEQLLFSSGSEEEEKKKEEESEDEGGISGEMDSSNDDL